VDFFAQQDQARRNTRLLIALFSAAVLVLIVLTNILVAGYFYIGEDFNIVSGSRSGAQGFASYFSWQRFGYTSLLITSTIAVVVLVKWIRLSSGGKTVAEDMGGVRILPQTRNRAERRCLNVVEEMALAASMPVPSVYVLNNERGINAFAAGITPANAVIGVTRGTITHLKRHELQGVIAHEISHILNGDMRLNIRLAAMLKGITFIRDVGELFLRGDRGRRGNASRWNSDPRSVPLGLILWAVGWLGSLAAGFIKAAISRQKEYLADASAVQFTRDAEGIGDALKVIGGYVPGTLVHTARATEMSHLFFGQIQHRIWEGFSTHPPLEQRIRRIEPGWNGEYISRKEQNYSPEPAKPGDGNVGVGRAAVVAAAIASEIDDALEADADFENTETERDPEQDTATQQNIPVHLVRYCHEPLGAQAITLGLIVHSEDSLAQEQLNLITEAKVQGLTELTNTLYPAVHNLEPGQRLPLLELCLPALKAMSSKQYRVFKNTLLKVIRADQKTDLFEWCMFQLLRHYLDPEFVNVRASRPRYRKLAKVKYHLRAVLSVLAYEGEGSAEECFARGAAELGFPDMKIMPRDQASVSVFSQAVVTLADCYPLLKPRVLKALVVCASDDAGLNPVQREIITSIAAAMDCPLPDISDL
jgi:Zn-dependent protease with chaperone function